MDAGADADVEMETDKALSGMAVEQHGESAPTAELPAADAATLTAQKRPPQGAAGGDGQPAAKQMPGLELISGEIDLGAAESVASELGFNLRPPQRAIIENMAHGRDGLYILGTGGGKSLCYVLPALAASPAGKAGGLTVLVVPLESLRVDQVRKANALAEKLQWKAGQLSFALSSATVAGRNDACRRQEEGGDGATHPERLEWACERDTRCGVCVACLPRRFGPCGPGRAKACARRCDAADKLLGYGLRQCRGCINGGDCYFRKGGAAVTTPATGPTTRTQSRTAATPQSEAEGAARRVTEEEVRGLGKNSLAGRILDPAGVRLLVTTPEHLESKSVAAQRTWLAVELSGRLRRFVVDEAHCATQMTYRPSYLRLGRSIRAVQERHVARWPSLGAPPVSAFTATIPPGEAEAGLIASLQLSIEPTDVLRLPIDRPNISYVTLPLDVRAADEPLLDIALRAVRTVRDNAPDYARQGKEMMYVSQAKQALSLARGFCKAGLPAVPYCTGKMPGPRATDGSQPPLMTRQQKDAAEKVWLETDGVLLIATEAYGMGVDRNISLIHMFELPASLFSDTQKKGRAGRTFAMPALVVTYAHSRLDLDRLRMGDGDDDEAADAAVVEAARGAADAAIGEVLALSTTCSCRRNGLLLAFGGRRSPCSVACCDSCVLHDAALCRSDDACSAARQTALSAGFSNSDADAAQALACSLLVQLLCDVDATVAARALVAAVQAEIAAAGPAPLPLAALPKLSTVFYEPRFRAGESAAPFDTLGPHVHLVRKLLGAKVLVRHLEVFGHVAVPRVSVDVDAARALRWGNRPLVVRLCNVPLHGRVSRVARAHARLAPSPAAQEHAFLTTQGEILEALSLQRRRILASDDPNALLALAPGVLWAVYAPTATACTKTPPEAASISDSAVCAAASPAQHPSTPGSFARGRTAQCLSSGTTSRSASRPRTGTGSRLTDGNPTPRSGDRAKMSRYTGGGSRLDGPLAGAAQPAREPVARRELLAPRDLPRKVRAAARVAPPSQTAPWRP
mmetsp:Transcript_12872/g.41133  ORF Transcript_12872/g.41133 Transcript_12872/m.41133 type:complete len:1029 (+) Transcript_12872:65-3151(+)